MNCRTLLLPLLLAPLAGLPAQDDRDRTTPTGAIWATARSTTDVQDLINQGFRITDLEIESTAPFLFTVAMVENTGAYAKTWWWAAGVTSAQLSTSLSTNNARLIDLEPYDDNGTARFCAVMVSNTGADQKTWWWGTGMTSAQVDASVATNNARLTSFRRYTVGGTTSYAAVMISNTGADQRSWGYLYGASSATINQNIAQNGNRIYGIERVAADSYDVILVHNSGFGHWYAFDITGAAVTELLEQNIGRLTDIERHSTLLGTRYNVVVLDNANTLEQAARQEFYGAAAGGLGDYGFFLKEVNGPVLAQMRPDFQFEPASTMKTVYHVHAMRQVHNRAISLAALVNKPLFCGVPGQDQTLQLTLSEMMEYSDNMSTLAISNHFGIANINATAAALGMSRTSINFTIGCSGPAPESDLTLRDLSTLHEQVANGYLGGQRAMFYELMAESLSFPSWGTEDLDARIDAEAAARGMPAAVRDAFKTGGIGWSPNGQPDYYFAEGGWMSVPFKNAAGVVLPREYTFGVFNYFFHAQESSGRNAMCDAELTLVWDRVRAALATWDNHVPGAFTPIVGVGCPGSAGTPLHTASGTPEIGNQQQYHLTNAPANAGRICVFGWSSSVWNAIPLPWNMVAIGAPNCWLRVAPAVTLFGIATPLGTSWETVDTPFSTSLIGLQLYSQFLVLDPPANTLGATATGAIRTTIGGWL
jgi:hypothetical protein